MLALRVYLQDRRAFANEGGADGAAIRFMVSNAADGMRGARGRAQCAASTAAIESAFRMETF